MFMGGRDMLLQRDAVKPKSVGASSRGFWVYFGKYWYVLLAVLALVVASTWFQVLIPELTGQAVNCYLVPATQAAFNQQLVTGAGAGPQAGAGCWSLPWTRAGRQRNTLRAWAVSCCLWSDCLSATPC